MLLAHLFFSVAGLTQQSPPAAATFVPSLHFAQHPVDFWLDELASTGGKSPRAVWSLYYHDDRSPRVVDALKRWLRADLDTSRAIDTVLNDWAVDFEALTVDEYLGTKSAPGGKALTPEDLARQLFQPRYRPADLELRDESSVLLRSVLDEARAATTREELERTRSERGSNPELAPWSYTDWPESVLRAACTLIVRGDHIASVLRALVEHSKPAWWREDSRDSGPSLLLRKMLPGAQKQVGSALAEVVGAELDRARDASEQLRWLNYLETLGATPGWSRINLRGALPSVAALLDHEGAVHDAAWKVLSRISDVEQDSAALADEDYHRVDASRSYDDTELDSVLADLLAPRLAASVYENAGLAAPLEWVHQTGLRSQPVRDACTPMLLEIARREDDHGLTALRILCHFGRADVFVKQRYVEWLSRWTGFDDEGIDRVPCLREHDAATLSALRSVFARAEHKALFEHRLACANLTDGYVEPMAQQMLEEIAASGWGYDGLVREGFRGILSSAPREDAYARVNRFALTIAAKRAHGIDWSREARDYAALLRDGVSSDDVGDCLHHMAAGFGHAIVLKLTTPEFVEAALRVAEVGGWPESYDRHVELACSLLDLCDLTSEQRARLYAADKKRRRDHGLPMPMDRMSASNAIRPREAVENVAPDAREFLYGGDWFWLRSLLRVTRLIPRDEAYLIATLQRGPAYSRLSAAGLVYDAKLDTPAIRAAVAKLAEDCDRSTRELARKIRAERGWN